MSIASRAASGHARPIQRSALYLARPRALPAARAATKRIALDQLVELAIGPSCTLGPRGVANSIHFSTIAFVSSKAASRASDCSSSCISSGR